MASRALNVGDNLIALRDCVNVKEGEHVTVKSVMYEHPCQNFFAEGRGDETYPTQAFEHAVKPMTAFEVEQNEGWINHATYHAAMVIFNDSTVLATMDAGYKRGQIKSCYFFNNYLKDKLPESYDEVDVDIWSIQLKRANELKDNNTISLDAFDRIEAKFVLRDSGCAKRRITLLQHHIDPEITDHHYDHYKYQKDLAEHPKTVDGFTVGQRVKYYKNDGYDKPMLATVVGFYLDATGTWIMRMDYDDHGTQEYQIESIRHLEPGDEPTVYEEAQDLYEGKEPKVPSTAQFKVGDRVKAVSQSRSWGSVEKGDIGIISSVNENHDSIEVCFPAHTNWMCSSWNLEHAPETAEECPQPVQEDKIMSQSMKVETKHFVNGTEIVNFDVADQADLIAKTEDRITKLKSLNTKTKAIRTEIAKLDKFLVDAVKLFDGEEETAAPTQPAA